MFIPCLYFECLGKPMYKKYSFTKLYNSKDNINFELIKKASSIRNSWKEKNKIQNHITKFRKEREELVSEEHRLENDIEYIEKLAREKYRMAKPGEKVFKVIDSNKKTKKE